MARSDARPATACLITGWLGLALLLPTGSARAQEDTRRGAEPTAQEQAKISQIERLGPKDASVVIWRTGDLDGDGAGGDLVAVYELGGPHGGPREESDDEILARGRVLRIFLKKQGRERMVVENSLIVPCSLCGGGLGDPVDDLAVFKGGFELNLYGGGAWRWNTQYEFRYSKTEDDWVLTRAKEETFHQGLREAP